MKKKKTFHIGTGITSLLMIFVILCLTTFGILSYTSANAEVALTKKNADYVEAYYNAYSKGSVVLADIDRIIFDIPQQEDINTYYQYVEENIQSLYFDGCVIEVIRDSKDMLIEVSVDVTNKQYLFMILKVNEQSDSKRYNIISSYLKSELGSESYEEELPDMWGE